MSGHCGIYPPLTFQELAKIRMWLGIDRREAVVPLPCTLDTLTDMEHGYGEDLFNADDTREAYSQYLCKVIAGCLSGITVEKTQGTVQEKTPAPAEPARDSTGGDTPCVNFGHGEAV